MGTTKENFDRTFDMIKDITPEYQTAFVATDPMGENLEFRLCFRGYKSSNSFKPIINEELEEMILLLKKQNALNEVSNDYLQLLVLELEKSIETFKLINVRGEEFHFQV